MMNLQEIITDIGSLGGMVLFRHGFAFTSLGVTGNAANVFDAIIIRNPEGADCFTPKLAKSSKSLQEHIDFINMHQLSKAVVIAEDISFLSKCPSLKYLRVIPSDNAEAFDYSPLYNMPNISELNCATEYGVHRTQKTSIDYTYLPQLQVLDVDGDGNLNINKPQLIQCLSVSCNKARNLLDIVTTTSTKQLRLIQCRIRSLSGISKIKNLSDLSLWYNRSLEDVSEIVECAETIKSLSIEACPRITDFSFLSKLCNLEVLELKGNNNLPNLQFLSKLQHLKCFVFNMNVLDGNLTKCLSIPCVHSLRNRKHYNLSDANLPKGQGDGLREPFEK